MADINKVVVETQVPRDQIPGADLVTVKRDFTDAFWVTTAAAEKDIGLAPDGTFTAGRLTSSGAGQGAYHDFTTTAQAYLASFDVRSETGLGETVTLHVQGTGGGTTDSMVLQANLLTGEVTVSPTALDVIYADVLLDVGRGYHRLRLFFNSDGGGVRSEVQPPVNGSMLVVDPVFVPLPFITPYNAAYMTYSARQGIARPGAENGKISGVGVLTDDKETE